MNAKDIKFPVIILNGEYCMRNFRMSDAENYREFYNQPGVSRFLPDSMVPVDIQHSRREIEYIINCVRERASFYWAIAERESDKLIGGCGFHDWNKFHSRAEIAYDLHPDYWRRGISELAVRSSLRFAFSNMYIRRVTATTVRDNEASNKLLLKVGFKFEGTLRNYKYFKGKTIDAMMFSYVTSDFTNDVKNGKYKGVPCPALDLSSKGA